MELKNAEFARDILREMEAQVKSAAKRKRQATFYATNTARKLSPGAVAVYTRYADTGVIA